MKNPVDKKTRAKDKTRDTTAEFSPLTDEQIERLSRIDESSIDSAIRWWQKNAPPKAKD